MLQPDSLVLDGRFRVVRLLSEGGMGEVYLAEQVSLGRNVALKVLRSDLSQQQQASERFRREARLLSSVEHPSVVGVIDYGESEGRPCLVMELAEGETLQQALEPGPFPPERAVPVLVQLADGLAAIHEKGIIHRDLKPENVVLTRTARGELARLLDFGIARLAEPEEGQLAPNTISGAGVILGTPEYISPEQSFGGRLDARSDLYSFGVLAFRILSGKLPYVGPTPRHFISQHLSAEPIPLYQAAPELVAHVPLCELVMQCLKKNPAHRPQSALELSQALARSLRAPNPPTPAPEPPTPPRGDAVPSGALPLELVLAMEEPRRPAHTPSRGSPAADSKRIPPRPAPFRPSSASARAATRLRLIALGAVLAVAASVAVAVAVYRYRLENRAHALLASGRYAEVLDLLGSDDAERTPLARVKALRAAALHRLDRHEEELREAAGVDLEAVGDLGALLLDGLVEDYGRSNGRDRGVRKYFNSWPREEIRAPLKAMASGPASVHQWGALRYLDQAGMAQGLNLVELYIAALGSDDCGVRAQAARRLRQLGSLAALEPLEQLAEAPRELLAGAKGCGQDEAAEAARVLRRRTSP